MRCGESERAPTEADALLQSKKAAYCFSTHFLPASSQTLPAFSQSSLFVIVEPGPANAGAVKAIAMATVRMETMLF